MQDQRESSPETDVHAIWPCYISYPVIYWTLYMVSGEEDFPGFPTLATFPDLINRSSFSEIATLNELR